MTGHSHYITFAVAMFAMLNPIGNAALYLGMTAEKTASELRKTTFKLTLAVIIILLLSVWIGMPLLSAFGISIGAFETAGGLVVLLIGLSMIRAQPHHPDHHTKVEHNTSEKKDSVAVVPMAIPIVAGPGAISAIIVHGYYFTTTGSRLIESAICVGLAFLLCVVFLLAPYIQRLIGQSGMKIVTRIMGLILSAIAMQMIGSGVLDLLGKVAVKAL
jgi:multiple antibiotic resistance protein